jgi:hypothetical protein
MSTAEATTLAASIIPDPSVFEAAPPPEPRLRAHDSADEVEEPPPPTDDARGPWGAIIDSVLKLDPEATFGRLRADLSLDADHVSYAHVAEALDQADRRYFEASVLARGAKLEEQRVDREIAIRMEILRTAAREKLETEKRAAAEKVGSKAMGKASADEVRDRCFADWPDEMRSLERRSEEYHAARAVAEELATAWRSRASSLRELLAGLRGRQ